MTTYALIGFWTVALMTPGLDFAIVTQNAIAKGSRAGIWTAFGVAIGLCVHFFYVTLLLQSVSAAMQSWMWCLQFLGALFLLYIAAMIFYDLWRPMRSSRQATKLPMQSAWLQGFLTNVLNPKVGLLSISLFSSYLRGHGFVMLYGLYGVFVGMTFLLVYAGGGVLESSMV
ncbi:MAG: LysE family transporter [Bdellovibrionota bacterium]